VDAPCWRISGTHCRTDIGGEPIKKLELCCSCSVFRDSVDEAAFGPAFDEIAAHLVRYREMLQDRDQQLREVSMQLALGVSEVLDVLVRVTRGEYDARITGTSGMEVLEKLKEVTNGTINALVDEMHSRQQAAQQQQRLERGLQQAQKMEALGRLAGGVAHDFNNMLTVITSSAELLSRRLSDNEQASRIIASISQAGDRSATLVRRLLTFSRSSLTEPEVISPREVLRGMLDMLCRLMGEDVRLLLDVDADTSRVRVDRGQIEQVVLNLAVNARDAMPMGGTLTISTRDVRLEPDHPWRPVLADAGEYVMISATDTGVGMDEETAAKIFEPFFTTKEASKGTGLGLTVVHGTVSRSGGHIHVESAPGEGTGIHIFLPRVGGVETPPAVPPTPRSSRGSETLLVVEDDDMVRPIVEEMLLEDGYQVITAAGAAEALRHLEADDGTIALLLTDVVMPEVGGCELAARARELRPDLKVVFMSGYADSAIAERGISPAEAHILSKPFTVAALARKIRTVLDR
jgi:signal transduction histidine kinase